MYNCIICMRVWIHFPIFWGGLGRNCWPHAHLRHYTLYSRSISFLFLFTQSRKYEIWYLHKKSSIYYMYSKQKAFVKFYILLLFLDNFYVSLFFLVFLAFLCFFILYSVDWLEKMDKKKAILSNRHIWFFFYLARRTNILTFIMD